jgi:hypothetical protein
MNRSIILLLFSVALLVVLSSQTISQPIWVSTGENVVPALMKEHENGYFLIARNTRLLPNGAISESMADITNRIVYADKEMNVRHTKIISMIGDWNIMLSESFLTDSETILLSGIAYNESLDEYSIGMVWTDTALNVLHDTVLVMENYKLNPHGWMVQNQQGNLVTYGTFSDLEKPFAQPSTDHYFFMVLDHQGNLLEFSEQFLTGFPFYLVPVGDDKYHMWATNNTILQLNNEFTYETSFSTDLPAEITIPRLKPYLENRYFLYGDFFVDAGNGFYDTDLAVIVMDSVANVMDSFIFGFADTSDRGAQVSFYHPDTLFLGGARNVQPFPEDSTDFNHLFVHKTSVSGEIVATAFYGANGMLSMGGILATSDGGCIMAGQFYDFLTHPESEIRDAVFVKVNPDGTITNLEEKKTSVNGDSFVVYPNPARDQIFIQSNSRLKIRALLYNSTGVLISGFEFVSRVGFDVSGLPVGVYLLQLITPDGTIKTRKVLLNY